MVLTARPAARHKFHRQWRIENWVVDFYCFERRLAIELDGAVHSQPNQMWKDAAKELSAHAWHTLAADSE